MFEYFPIDYFFMFQTGKIIFGKFKIGDKASIIKKFTQDDVLSFSKLSCDTNPLHFDDNYAKTIQNKEKKSLFQGKIIHGILLGSLFSGLAGTKLPGSGCIYLSQSFKFIKPAYVEEEIEATIELIEQKRDIYILKTTCVNKETGELLLSGEATVYQPNPQ